MQTVKKKNTRDIFQYILVMTPVSLLTSILDHSQLFFSFCIFPLTNLSVWTFDFVIMDKRRHIVDYILIDFVTFFFIYFCKPLTSIYKLPSSLFQVIIDDIWLIKNSTWSGAHIGKCSLKLVLCSLYFCILRNLVVFLLFFFCCDHL